MLNSRLMVATLLLLPAAAFAQKKGGSMGGSKETDWNSVAGKTAPAGPTISSKDFENASPFKLLLDKKKDLKLTDAQMTALKDSDTKLKDSNHDRFAMLDSLKRDAKPRTSGTVAAEDEARMVIARDAMQNVAHDIQTSFADAAKTAVPMLDDSQKPAAQKVLDKYDEDMQAMLREKLGVRRAGGGSMGRGGRPPLSPLYADNAVFTPTLHRHITSKAELSRGQLFLPRCRLVTSNDCTPDCM